MSQENNDSSIVKTPKSPTPEKLPDAPTAIPDGGSEITKTDLDEIAGGAGDPGQVGVSVGIKW